MPKFKDRNGKDWSVNLTVASLKRVDEQAEFDLLNLLDENLNGLAALYDNPIKLVEVVYAICEPQIEAAEMTPEEFGESFAGQSLHDAAEAVVEATAAFYQSPKQGEILRAMKAKVERGVDHHLARLGETVNGLSDDEIKNAIDQNFSDETPSEKPSEKQTVG